MNSEGRMKRDEGDIMPSHTKKERAKKVAKVRKKAVKRVKKGKK